MKQTIKVGTLTAAATFLAFYLLAAFVLWDVGWIFDLGNWRPVQRAMFVYFMVIIPFVFGSVAGSEVLSENGCPIARGLRTVAEGLTLHSSAEACLRGADEIEDLKAANETLHGLVTNREAEIERLKVERDAWMHETDLAKAKIETAESALRLVREALKNILSANDEFRASLPADWEGDPLHDACEAARPLVAVYQDDGGCNA